jgi:hypothetical protein
MKPSKSVNPTGSYTIMLPADVCEDKDDRVMSNFPVTLVSKANKCPQTIGSKFVSPKRISLT